MTNKQKLILNIVCCALNVIFTIDALYSGNILWELLFAFFTLSFGREAWLYIDGKR
jgi:hypothetical protein